MSISKPIYVGILTVSDRCARGERVDESGPRLGQLVSQQGWTVDQYETVPDETQAIQDTLLDWCDRGTMAIILTTGGTGLSPRDVTPASTREILDKEVPGLAELMRYQGQKKNPYAYLSQAVCGIRKNTLIINLPGSPIGAAESFEAIRYLLPHAAAMMAGQSHPEREEHAHSH